jgi:hypothetical protein
MRRGGYGGYIAELPDRFGGSGKRLPGRASTADVKTPVRRLDVIPLGLRTRIKSKCALCRFYNRGTGRFIWIVVGSTGRLGAIALIPGSVRSNRLL